VALHWIKKIVYVNAVTGQLPRLDSGYAEA